MVEERVKKYVAKCTSDKHHTHTLTVLSIEIIAEKIERERERERCKLGKWRRERELGKETFSSLMNRYQFK
jgi:hypothetical protein